MEVLSTQRLVYLFVLMVSQGCLANEVLQPNTYRTTTPIPQDEVSGITTLGNNAKTEDPTKEPLVTEGNALILDAYTTDAKDPLVSKGNSDAKPYLSMPTNHVSILDLKTTTVKDIQDSEETTFDIFTITASTQDLQLSTDTESKLDAKPNSSKKDQNEPRCKHGEFWSETEYRCLSCGYCCGNSKQIKDCLDQSIGSDMSCKQDDNCREPVFHKYRKIIISVPICFVLTVFIISLVVWWFKWGKKAPLSEEETGIVSSEQNENDETEEHSETDGNDDHRGHGEQESGTPSCQEVYENDPNDFGRDFLHGVIQEI